MTTERLPCTTSRAQVIILLDFTNGVEISDLIYLRVKNGLNFRVFKLNDVVGCETRFWIDVSI
jgi:hypothetical protein